MITAEYYVLYRFDTRTMSPIDRAARAPDGFLEDYERVGRHDDPVLEAALRDQAPRDQHLATVDDEWRGAAAYEVFSRAGLAHSLQVPIRIAGEISGTLNFARTSRQRAFDNEDLRHAALASQVVGAALSRAARFDVG